MASTSPREHRECGSTRRRSRFGCRNCKLRKLKCDETKPHCKRCSSFGVVCNFTYTIPDLHPIAAESRTLLVQRKPQPQPPVTSAAWTADESSCYQLNARCQDFITRYLGRSLITPDDPEMVQVNRELFRLAFTSPFLMHASLAVAFTYDRHLNNSPTSRRSLEECYHWSQSTTLLNKRLTRPITNPDKDPIWGTAAALAILAFSSPDVCTPEESWPLKSSSGGSGSDLDWLQMSEGKMALWEIVNPLRPESLFRVMRATFAVMSSPLPEKGVDGIPPKLAAVCGMGGGSTAETNPYFEAVHALASILDLEDNGVTTGQVELFRRAIHGAFADLLRTRDPVALVLLYLWYRKAGRSIWWIELRTRLECPAICEYLRLYHKGNAAVQELLTDDALTDRRDTSDLTKG